MHHTITVPLPDLILDTRNARLGDEQPSQQAVYLALAKQQGHRLVVLAESIVEHGTDPTNLPAVVATSDRRRKYKVMEGNRRVLTLKALDTPSIVGAALSPSDQKKLARLAVQYAKNPVDEIPCVLFDSEEEALEWIRLRHTGANEGAGLVEWSANEQDRFLARHGNGRPRNPAGQVLDFIDSIDGPPDPSLKTRISTTLQRVLDSKEVRDALGVRLDKGEITSDFPANEVAKGLRRIVTDLRTEAIKVGDVYYAEDKAKYLARIGPEDRPDPSTRQSSASPLAGLPTGTAAKPSKKVKVSKPLKSAPRTAIVPKACPINPSVPRINSIFNELASLDADTYPNACSVLIRVFLELTVDHESDQVGIPRKATDPLAKRLKSLADHMESAGRINDQLKRAMHKVADSKYAVAASTVNFNQYVHNRYIFPKPTELRDAWDEMQPFLEKVWA